MMTARQKLVLVSTAMLLALAAGVALALLWPTRVPEFSAVKATWTPSDAYLLDRNGEVLDQERMDFSVRRFEWTTLGNVSPALTDAIIDGEDRRFWQHDGVDWTAILAAVRDNSVARRRRGGSTISMQVAALLEPTVRAGSTSGAWARKLAQVRMARSLESRWTKPQILEAYLNLLGFRGELQGIAAASRTLSGKAPSGLSVPESLVLAALLPAPRATPDRVVARACARAAARQLAVDCTAIRTAAATMLAAYARPGEIIGAAESSQDDVRSSSINSRPETRTIASIQATAARRAASEWAPRLAPHLARALLTKPGERLRTTLDADLQRTAMRVLRQHLGGLSERNVRDGAVLIVDNETGEVLAYVGSAGPNTRSGQVDGVRAHRQAGSTLKPFLYELALEQRYLNAASLLDDSPITLDTASGIYLPQDYDRDFKGLVSVRTALGSSLNVPAVRTLVLTGVEPFRDRLHSLGYAGITQPGDFYGYSLALGSAEVSLWEQVQAYRALARDGEWAPIKLTRTAVAAAHPLLARDASYVVTDMLSDRAARMVTFGLDSYLNTPFWSAVKTGTSKDMRDNWCIGFSRQFTVGVWVGNFEGDSMHDVSGVTGAAPVWQQLMVALHATQPSTPPAAPPGVVTTLVHFSPAVEAPRKELFLRAVDSTTTSATIADGTRAANSASNQATSDSLTSDDTHITAVTSAGDIARIASPANGMVIALDPDIPPARQRVPLSARGRLDGMVLRMNGAVVGPAGRHVMWSPQPGTYLLALEDSSGHTLDSARFTVR